MYYHEFLWFMTHFFIVSTIRNKIGHSVSKPPSLGTTSSWKARQDPKRVCHVPFTPYLLCHRTEVHILFISHITHFIESLWDAIALVSARQMKCGSPPWTYLTYRHKLLSSRWAPRSKVSHDGGPLLNISCFKRNTIVGRILVSPSSCQNKFHSDWSRNTLHPIYTQLSRPVSLLLQRTCIMENFHQVP